MNNSRALKLLGFFYGIMTLSILTVCIVGQDILYRYRKEFLLDNDICVILGVILYLILLGIFHICVTGRKIQKYIPRIMFLLSIVFTGVIYVMGYHYSFRTGWDVSYLLNTAEGLAYNQSDKVLEWYFSTYPNNILLVAIYTCIYKMGAFVGISNAYFVLLFLQSAIFSWTGYLIYRISDMFFGNEKIKYTLLCWGIYMGLVGVSPWVVIPYSDTAALFIVSLSVFLIFKTYKKGVTVFRLFGIAFCGMFGFYIKPQAFIILIAVALVIIVTDWKKLLREYKRTLKYIMVVCTAFVTVFVIVQGATAFCGFEINKEEKFGITHFFMMGLNAESCGTISNEDVGISGDIATYDERCKANMAEALRRIEKMGIRGLADLAVKKTLVNYNDGTFGWSVEGNFYAEMYEIGNDFLRYFLRGFYYEELNHYQLFTVWMQILWMGTLLLNIFSVMSIKDKRVAMLALAIVGLTMFELIFEARARYLFAYAPIYIVLAVIGMQNIMVLCKRIRSFWRTK